MSKWAGVRGSRICLLSDTFFTNNDCQTVEVPEELNYLDSYDLLENYHFKAGKIINKYQKKNIDEMKIAYVGNFRMECGISTYNEYLVSELAKKVKNYKLFAEYNDKPVEPFSKLQDKGINPDNVVQCWKRGEELSELVAQIHIYDPDIIVIGHEWGLFSNARYFLSFMTQINAYRTILILHSVFYHMDKLIVEAAMSEIIVHIDGAKEVLKNNKEVGAKVYVIPHGCPPAEKNNRLWNFYKSKHTFVQLGFGFSYKNFQASIKAAAILKPKYPDIFFTGILSESPHNKYEHQLYYEQLVSLTRELQVEGNVALVRGFQSDKVLDSYFRTNNVAVFPYSMDPKHEVFGASGMARVALSKNIPIITSYGHHFSDLPTLKAHNPEEIAEHLDNLFSNQVVYNNQLKIQGAFLEQTSWSHISDKFIEIFENPPGLDKS